MSTARYLDGFFEPMTEAFTPALARTILDYRADPELQAQIEVFRRKANEGTLTPEEDVEYKEFVEAVDIISMIQAKARKFLAQHSV